MSYFKMKWMKFNLVIYHVFCVCQIQWSIYSYTDFSMFKLKLSQIKQLLDQVNMNFGETIKKVEFL